MKLDQLYPQAGLAVRFVGLTAKGQPKQSDWELEEDALRDQTREELCRQHGVELFLLDPDHPHPNEQLQRLRTILSRLSRTLAQSDRPNQDKATIMPRLAEARGRLDDITRRVKSPDNLPSVRRTVARSGDGHYRRCPRLRPQPGLNPPAPCAWLRAIACSTSALVRAWWNPSTLTAMTQRLPSCSTAASSAPSWPAWSADKLQAL